MKTFQYLILIIFLAATGCSTQQLAVRMTGTLMDGQIRSIQQESDPVLAERAIPANLKFMEGLLESDGNNLQLLHALAEGYCKYAFAYVEDDDPERASALYLRGKRYALRSLAGYENGQNLAAVSIKEFPEALREFEVDAMPGLFWLTQSWAGWLNLNLHNPEALADISKVEALALRIRELDETFMYGGPDLLLGAFYGGRTKLLGGDPDKARAHFEKSLDLGQNKFLPTLFWYAKTVAVTTRDRELFERLLNRVLETPADVLPERRLANEIAKIKAGKLLDSANDIF